MRRPIWTLWRTVLGSKAGAPTGLGATRFCKRLPMELRALLAEAAARRADLAARGRLARREPPAKRARPARTRGAATDGVAVITSGVAGASVGFDSMTMSMAGATITSSVASKSIKGACSSCTGAAGAGTVAAGAYEAGTRTALHWTEARGFGVLVREAKARQSSAVAALARKRRSACPFVDVLMFTEVERLAIVDCTS